MTLEELKPRQRSLLATLALGGGNVRGAAAGDGFYVITMLGFRAPTAQALERHGLVETRYERELGIVTAKLTDTGQALASTRGEP